MQVYIQHRHLNNSLLNDWRHEHTYAHSHPKKWWLSPLLIPPARREGEMEVRVYLGPGPRGRTGPPGVIRTIQTAKVGRAEAGERSPSVRRHPSELVRDLLARTRMTNAQTQNRTNARGTTTNAQTAPGERHRERTASILIFPASKWGEAPLRNSALPRRGPGLAEWRSPHPLHADGSRAAAWLLPELRLLHTRRPSAHAPSSFLSFAKTGGKPPDWPGGMVTSLVPPLQQEAEQQVSAGAPPTPDVGQSEVMEAR